MDDVRVYESPPRRPDPWLAERPGDFMGAQPRGDLLGTPGPDPGYALKLAEELFVPKLQLGDVAVDDAVAGCLAVALKRSSMFGRAPIARDLRLAFRLWGFLDEPAPPELAELRRRLFEEASHPHHYRRTRIIADTVPESTLRMQPDEVHPADWRKLLDLDDVPVVP
jgi:hypothetical protein